jgi:diketogulonate reductase-like aldo/keto reductase
VVGLGTWITFNVGTDPVLLDECVPVMAAFFEAGGTVIDSSPMYGSSQDTVGHGLAKLRHPPVFAADKVWTPTGGDGREQIAHSRRKWGVPRFDLVQVHNLVDWREHLETLFTMKAAGEIGHIGITTSHGRRHELLERIMREYPLDFVQLTYNMLDREPEERLLPLARDRGIAVMALCSDQRLTAFLAEGSVNCSATSRACSARSSHSKASSASDGICSSLGFIRAVFLV